MTALKPIQYYYPRLAPRGTTLYYTTCFLPVHERENLLALFAWREDINKIYQKGMDPTVQQQKLTWWQQEIERIFTQQPTHPISQVLHQAISALPQTQDWTTPIKTLLLNVLAHAAVPSAYTTFADLILHTHQTTSALLMLSCYLNNNANPDTLTFAKEIGTVVYLVEQLRDLRKFLQQDTLLFALEDLTEFKVEPEQLLLVPPNANYLALLRHYARKAYDMYAQAVTNLPRHQHASQRGLLILAKLRIALLKEIERDNFPILTHRVSLTPLRKLWGAWRIRS